MTEMLRDTIRGDQTILDRAEPLQGGPTQRLIDTPEECALTPFVEEPA